MEMLLQGDGLTAIVSAVSGFLQTDVGMIDADGAVQARSGAGNTPDALAQIAAHLVALARGACRSNGKDRLAFEGGAHRW